MTKKLFEVRDRLNKVSPSFCLAKWTQVTVHLQNGQTHSCHHPFTHKIPLDELEKDPSSLHNTSTKKNTRKLMKEGSRPKECDYCWTIEDANKNNLSDRVLKSSHDLDQLEKIEGLPWDAPVTPRYLEVSFGNECNFRCAYCAPNISSALMLEYQKYGHYKTMPGFSMEELKRDGLYPYDKHEENPYVAAFWQWWPSVSPHLHVFRITGGEPLINSNTFRFLDYIIENPMPHLELAINSNLGIPQASFDKFLEKISFILENKFIKKFGLYTSVDTYGKNAEFVRFGLNYAEFMQNVRKFLKTVPEAELNFMCTYNAFSVVNFHKLLDEVAELKNTFRNEIGFNRVHLDTPYLKNPIFLSCYVLTKDFFPIIRKDLEFIRERSIQDEKCYSLFTSDEVSKFERILKWLESLEENNHRDNTRRALYVFLNEYQKRKQIKFEDYCPEYLNFYNCCKLAHLG